MLGCHTADGVGAAGVYARWSGRVRACTRVCVWVSARNEPEPETLWHASLIKSPSYTRERAREKREAVRSNSTSRRVHAASEHARSNVENSLADKRPGETPDLFVLSGSGRVDRSRAAELCPLGQRVERWVNFVEKHSARDTCVFEQVGNNLCWCQKNTD